MRGVGLLPSGRDRLGGHVEMAVLHLHVVPRHLVVLETGFSLTRQPVEFVTVPRTLDEVAVEAPLPQGSARVVADSRDRPECALFPGDREERSAHTRFGDRRLLEFLHRTQVMPLHGTPPPPCRRGFPPCPRRGARSRRQGSRRRG